MLRTRDITVISALSIVRLRGYEPDTAGTVEIHGIEYPLGDSGLDLPGSANWLCAEYGMAPEDHEESGILWTDYDAPADEPWAFAILIAADEIKAFTALARGAGYQVRAVEPVTEPICFGDGCGVATILKHPDGWVVAR